MYNEIISFEDNICLLREQIKVLSSDIYSITKDKESKKKIS